MEQVHGFDKFWGAILTRFGLGARLILCVTSLAPSEFHTYVTQSDGHLYDRALAKTEWLFYLDNLCHASGTQVLVVVRELGKLETRVPCATFEPNEALRTHVHSALATPGAHAYLVDPETSQVTHYMPDPVAPSSQTGSSSSVGSDGPSDSSSTPPLPTTTVGWKVAGGVTLALAILVLVLAFAYSHFRT